MFECTACTLRCIKAIAVDTISIRPLPNRRLIRGLNLASHPLTRHASTATATKPPDDGFVPFQRPGGDALIKIRTPKLLTAEEKRSGAHKNGNNTAISKVEGATRPNAITIDDKAALLKELEWLPDRLKLAQHVHYVLRCNDPQKALDLCRLASRKEEVIVSWNHVIDWYMKQGKVEDAMKVYNEMKKRAQFPDAHTYTLILRGLAGREAGKSTVSAKNVVRAVTIYNSLSAPNSRVRPNIYHTNATLKVCGEATDMDALWGIVAKLPDSGPGAPDRITYGIIINAIRRNAFGHNAHQKGSLDTIPRRQDQALSEGRGVWKDIIARWRAGEVIIDEHLVLEMARLLLASSRMQDWDDVLNLFQQTMKIERLIPPLGSPNRKVEHVPQLRSANEEDVSQEDNDGWTGAPSGKAFLPVHSFQQRQHYRQSTSLAYARPGPGTLTALVKTCMQLRIAKTAGQYWDLLTSAPYNVTPKLEAYHTMLHLLQRNRASAKAALLLRDGMISAGIQPTYTTYVLALVTCSRDVKNPNVLENARELIDLMQRTSDAATDPNFSVDSLILYLMISLSTDSGPKILATLDHIHPMTENLEIRAKSLSSREEQVVLHLFRCLVGVINTIDAYAMIKSEVAVLWKSRKAFYSRFISLTKAEGSLDRVSTQRPGRTGGNAVEDEDEDPGVVVGNGGYENAIVVGRTEPALQAFRRRQAAKVTGQNLKS